MAFVTSLSMQAITELPPRHYHSALIRSSADSGGHAWCATPRFDDRHTHQSQQLLVRKASRRLSRSGALPAVTAVVVAAKSTDVPTVAATKRKFLEAYRRPIPSIYSTILQELLVQQHLMRYNATYLYDGVFGLGFVTVFDQLFDGYPNGQEREAIFKAYINALNESPDQYKADATKLEEWAKQQNATSIVSFAERDGDGEAILNDIAGRAAGKGNFHYSRFFAIGLFRLLEISKASDPATLEKLAKAINVNKMSIERDLDVYRNLLSKLTQSKELLKEYLDREKRKVAERAEEKATAAAKKEKTEAKSE